eukprot:scaffold8090_cov36-Prasinocladus_malaysianus.AAC.2
MGAFGKMICFGKEHLLARRCSPPAGDKPMPAVLDCHHPTTITVVNAQKVPRAAGFMRSGKALGTASRRPQPNASVQQVGHSNKIQLFASVVVAYLSIYIIVPADQHIHYCSGASDAEAVVDL